VQKWVSSIALASGEGLNYIIYLQPNE
jgi:hypothetical protein